MISDKIRSLINIKSPSDEEEALMIETITDAFTEIQIELLRLPPQDYWDGWEVSDIQHLPSLSNRRRMLLEKLRSIHETHGVSSFGNVAFIGDCLIVNCGDGCWSRQVASECWQEITEKADGSFDLKLLCNGEITDVQRQYL